MSEIEKYYNEIFNLSGRIATLIAILPIIFAFFYRKYFDKALKIILWYISIRLVLNILLELFIWSANKHYLTFWKPILKTLKIENTLFFNVFFMFNLYFTLGLFYVIIINKHKNLPIIRYVSYFLIGFQLINYFFIEGYTEFGVIGQSVASLFMIILPCYYLWHISNKPPELIILKNSFFWISIALFVPHLIALLFIFTADKIYDDNFILYCKLHIAKNGVEILTQFAFAYAFYLSKYIKYLR